MPSTWNAPSGWPTRSSGCAARWRRAAAPHPDVPKALLPLYRGPVLDLESGMANPDYVVCLECETPCYTFEWEDGRITEALCAACGNDNTDQFASPEELEELDS